MVDTKSLVKLIEILEPLSSEERLRNINSALTALGDLSLTTSAKSPEQHQHHQDGAGGGGHYQPDIAKRLRQNGISSDLAERIFDFQGEGAFAIISVPGRSRREQALNTYVLFGLGTFLATGSRDFADAAAREACKSHGCYDQPNHATTLKSKHPAFIAKGDDWSLTIPGIKDGMALMKEVADAAVRS